MVPKYLYKYRRFDVNGYWRSLLTDQILYFSAPKDFNDPFECKARFDFDATLEEKVPRFALMCWLKSGQVGNPKDYLPTALHALKHEDAGNEKHGKWAEGQLHLSLAQTFGILCLAEDEKNILMWSHYAENHTGFCVRFDTTVDSKFFRNAKQVSYHTKYPVLNWWKADLGEITNSMAYNKSHHWSYEKEWRILETSAGIKCKFRAKAIDSIILGCRISDENQKEIMDIVKKFPFKIKVLKATLEDIRYEIRLEEII